MSIFHQIADEIAARLQSEAFLSGVKILSFREKDIESEFAKFEGQARGDGLILVGWAGCKNDAQEGAGPVVRNDFVISATFKQTLRKGMNSPDDIVSEVIRSIHDWTPSTGFHCYDTLYFQDARPVEHPHYLIYRIAFSGTSLIKPITT